MDVPARPAEALPPGPQLSYRTLMRTGVAQLFGRALPMHDSLAAKVGEYGDLVRVRMPNDVYIASHPDHVRKVLTADARITVKGRVTRYLRLGLGNGLVTAEGAEHTRNRRLVAPAFSHEQMAGYAEVFAAVVADLDEEWSRRVRAGGPAVDMTQEMAGMTLRAAGLALFGFDLRDRAAEVTQAIADIQRSLAHVRSPIAPVLLRGPSPVARRLRGGVRVIHGVVDEVIAQHQAHPERFTGDALSRLLAARDDDGTAMPIEQVRDEVTTLLIAGHETTATLLSWAWYNLDANPAAAELLHAETDGLGRPPRPQDAFEPGLPVARAVVAETLRVRPPIWVIGRTYEQAGELDGCPVHAGTDVILPQWVTHRDRRWWGDDADQFRPQRWLTSSPEAGLAFDAKEPGQPRGAYFPFGAGRRICIGEAFAWTEAVLALATLARRWAPRMADDRSVDEDALITLCPKGGLPMVLVPRGQ